MATRKLIRGAALARALVIAAMASALIFAGTRIAAANPVASEKSRAADEVTRRQVATPTEVHRIVSFAANPAASEKSRVVVDETGRQVTVPAEVHRIVSLAPNLTETIYAIGAGARLAGDTDFCDVPDEAHTKPHVGAPINPSLEAIVALKPDLVLASASINWPATADALLKMGVPVYTTDPHSVNDMVTGITHIGALIGAETEANSLVADLRARLDALEKKLAGRPPRRVLFIVWDDPLISIGQPHIHHGRAASFRRRLGDRRRNKTGLTWDWSTW